MHSNCLPDDTTRRKLVTSAAQPAHNHLDLRRGDIYVSEIRWSSYELVTDTYADMNRAADPFEVVVVGNAGVDTKVYLDASAIDLATESHFVDTLDCVAHSGAYSSRGFANLGRRTTLVAGVNDDALGRWVRDTLEADGVDLSFAFADVTATARSVNFMSPDGRRKSFYDGRGHMEIEIDVGAASRAFDGARLAHFSLPNWARRLLAPARAAGAVVACDLQDVRTIDDPYRRDFVLGSSILFCSGANFADPRDMVEGLLAASQAKVIVVGLGARGCLVGTPKGIDHYAAVAGDAPVRDTNGAGDALAAGFLTSYVLEGRTLADSALRGQIAARHACSVRGAAPGDLISSAELDRAASGRHPGRAKP